MKQNSRTFDAMLERLTRNKLGWVIARVPFDVEKAWGKRGLLKVVVKVASFEYPIDVEKAWGKRGLLKVVVKVASFEYPTSLFPTGSGEHFILVNKKMQKAARIGPGKKATFTVTPDLTPRELTLPIELVRALSEDRRMRKWFDGLKYSIRKWLSDIVAGAKSPETRTRRAERVAEQVLATMEAEKELPPMIRQAFNRHPEVAKIFKQMTPNQRRGTLFAVFYYRTPESQLKRLLKIAPDEFAND